MAHNLNRQEIHGPDVEGIEMDGIKQVGQDRRAKRIKDLLRLVGKAKQVGGGMLGRVVSSVVLPQPGDLVRRTMCPIINEIGNDGEETELQWQPPIQPGHRIPVIRKHHYHKGSTQQPCHHLFV